MSNCQTMFTILYFSIRYGFLYSFWQRLIHHVNYLRGGKLSHSCLWFSHLLSPLLASCEVWAKAKKKCISCCFQLGVRNLKLYQPLLLLCKPFSYLAPIHSLLKRFGKFRLQKNIKLVHTRQVLFHNVKTAPFP